MGERGHRWRGLNRAYRRLAIAGCLSACAWSATGPIEAAQSTLQSTRSEAGLYLRRDGKIPVVERSNGLRSPVPIRPYESISAFAELTPGWIAVGSGSRPGTPGGDLSRELVLITGGNGPTRRLPAPPGRSPRLRLSPTPVVAGGELLGLVWLEGSDLRSLSVVAASWDGSAWGRGQQIAAPGPGSQLAPTVAVTDGTWTVAWSRFDSRDDEIYWSRRVGENWSTPQRAHPRHAGPDATPALVATASGELLLSWMRFESGQYRTVISRLGRSGWYAPARIGPAASLFPTFTRTDDRTYLLHRDVIPLGWTVTEVDRTGRALRRATVTSDANQRPVLSEATTSSPKLSWPTESRSRSIAWEAVP